MAKQKTNPVWWDIFIAEYLTNGQNGVQAMLKAKPKMKLGSAAVESSKLLRNPKFSVVLEAAQKNVSAKVGMKFERWLQLLCDVAEFDIREYIKLEPGSGDVQLVENWKQKANGHALESVNFRTTTLESGQVVQRVEIKRDNKLKALEMIGKAIGYLKDKVEHSGSLTISAADILDDDLKEKPE